MQTLSKSIHNILTRIALLTECGYVYTDIRGRYSVCQVALDLALEAGHTAAVKLL